MLNRPDILDINREETLKSLDQRAMEQLLELEGLSVAMIGLMAEEPEHFPQGVFDQLVDVSGVIGILDKRIPQTDQWSEANQPETSRVQVIGFEKPEVSAAVRGLAAIVKALPQAAPGTEKRDQLLREYGRRIDLAAQAASEIFHHELTPNTVTLTLLSGGKRVEPLFEPPSIEMNGRVVTQRAEVDAKRLAVTSRESVEGEEETEEKTSKLVFGFRDWVNLEVFAAVQEKYGDIRLVIPDDCLATAGSVISAVKLLKDQGFKISEVVFYGTLGDQSGITLLIEEMEKLGVNIKINVAELNYGLNAKGYLVTNRDGEEGQAVGDMGETQKEIAALEAVST